MDTLKKLQKAARENGTFLGANREGKEEHMNYKTHDCGGTILMGGTPGTETHHIYCDECGAFSHDPADIEKDRLPTGTDREKNHQAFDDGDEKSPEDPNIFWAAIESRARELGATEEEAKAIAEGGFQAANEEDVIDNIDGFIESELDLLRENESEPA